MSGKDYISLNYDKMEAKTELAVLLVFGDQEEWIPLSLIDPDFLLLDKSGGEVAIEYWKVEQAGLEDYCS
jgi:hypothetical protein